MGLRRILRTGRAAAGALGALALALGVCSCAAYLLPSGGARTIVAERGPDEGLRRIAPLRKGGSRLLYLYERGLVLHDAGRYRDSNAALAEADELYEDLYTKSLTREVLSLATFEELVPYRGPAFESAFAHYYRVLNFLQLGESEAAAVECRRLNRELERCRDGQDSIYADDPFLQYVTAVVYRMTRNLDDADVSLRVARQGYRTLAPMYDAEPPPALERDLVANARSLGDVAGDDGPPDSEPSPHPADAGIVYLLLEFGSVPAKVERMISLPVYRDEVRTRPDPTAYARANTWRCGAEAEHGRELAEVLNFALPALENTAPRAGGAVVRAGAPDSPGEQSARATVAADLEALSHRAFEADYDRILVRAIARGISKLAAREAAHEREEKEQREKRERERASAQDTGNKDRKPDASGVWMARITSWLVSLFAAASERADVRCWSTLPGQILTTQLTLPSGRHPLEAEVFDAQGRQLGTWKLGDVDVVAGGIQIARFRIEHPSATSGHARFEGDLR